MNDRRLTPGECSNDMFPVDPFVDWKDETDEDLRVEDEIMRQRRTRPHSKFDDGTPHLIIGRDDNGA